MILVRGEDIFEKEIGQANLLLVTTNAMVTRAGLLVMGRGAARQAAVRFPDLPRTLAVELQRKGLVGSYYGLLIPEMQVGPQPPGSLTYVGAFQVKIHWRDAADLNLIRGSSSRLTGLARKHPTKRFAVNMPGTGNGRLAVQDVMPIIEELPDNVWVYQRDE